MDGRSESVARRRPEAESRPEPFLQLSLSLWPCVGVQVSDCRCVCARACLLRRCLACAVLAVWCVPACFGWWWSSSRRRWVEWSGQWSWRLGSAAAAASRWSSPPIPALRLAAFADVDAPQRATTTRPERGQKEPQAELEPALSAKREGDGASFWTH